MSQRALMAKTHPAEYLLHKYWARKPHNVLQEYISSLFKPGDILVDPFCGSGVFLAEAKKLGISSIGYDINPIACLISKVTTDPPVVKEFIEHFSQILDDARKKYQDQYLVNVNKEIRYLVHEMTSKCISCKQVSSISTAKKKGSRYYCPSCGIKLSFNFENFEGTNVVKVITKDNIEYKDRKNLILQQRISNSAKHSSKFDVPLLVNRRILAFPGMRLSDLFTPRAFRVFSDLFQSAHRIKDPRIREAILLLLTSSVAQCSRLIPCRNDLATGGPAWTIPGFWIAPLHLETNPLIHLEARFKKYIRGLESLHASFKNNTHAEVEKVPAQKGLKKIKNKSVSGIFFDPPYGDNVPYVEFSAIWNAFLNEKIEYNQEIVVSDRKEFVSSWDKYTNDINTVISLFRKKLKKSGKILMTFNNLDPRAWKIVLGAFAANGFICSEAKYQIPAVVSSKSQTSANTSYVGDYYCLFEKSTTKSKVNSDIFYLTKKLRDVIVSRRGKAPVNLVRRVAILTILNDSMDISLIERLEEAITPVASRKGEFYVLRPELHIDKDMEEQRIDTLVSTVAVRELKKGKMSVQDFYEKVMVETIDIGTPQLKEIKQMLKGTVLFEKSYCYLQAAELNLRLAI